ncbi:MAG: Bcr/CflA family efflux MFS transporter [Rubrivivax sp.]|nr:MAG: Bcr/CflA family efflux MFS transporter [Rubrivivax sp.]
MNASDPAPRLPPTWVTVVALSLLLGLQPITTDLYLPALPQMQRDLGVSPSAAQYTLSMLVLAFGIGQLVWGPVADRFGRRPVLRWGLSLFVLASALTFLADSLSLMVLARAAQGACLSAAVVCGRAMIRDLYAPVDGARMMAHGMGGLGVIALAGPVTGGFLATQWGWRYALAAVGVFGAIALLFVVWRLPETLPRERRTPPMHPAALLRDWWGIAQHPSFRAHALLTSGTFGGLYVCLAAGPFVFIDLLGCSRQAFGFVMASWSVSYLIGIALCRRLLSSRGLIGSVRVAGMMTLVAGLWMAGVSAFTVLSQATPGMAWLLPGLWLYACAHGIHQPCGQTGVVASFPRHAGAASALSGFVLASIAFGVGALLSACMRLPVWVNTIHPMTLGVAVGAACTAWVALHLVQRDGLAPAHT